MRRRTRRMFTICSAASLVVWVLLSLVVFNSYTIPGQPGGPHYYFRAWPTDWQLDSVGRLLVWPRRGSPFSVGIDGQALTHRVLLGDNLVWLMGE